MKVFLMYPHRNIDSDMGLPWNEKVLIQDLELNRILENMANGDKFLYEISKKVLLNMENEE